MTDAAAWTAGPTYSLRRADAETWGARDDLYLVVTCGLFWRVHTMAGVVLWGRPAVATMQAFADLAPTVVDVGRVNALTEAARVSFADAIGAPGVVVGGPGHAAAALVGTAVMRHPARVVAHLTEAVEPALAEAVERVLAAELGPLAVVHRLRSVLGADPKAGLATCARQLAMTGRSLQRALTLAGTSFANERTELRLELAATLLETSRLKVEAIARSVGYDSAPHFNTTFRDRYGETPSAFRERRDL